MDVHLVLEPSLSVALVRAQEAERGGRQELIRHTADMGSGLLNGQAIWPANERVDMTRIWSSFEKQNCAQEVLSWHQRRFNEEILDCGVIST